MKIRTIHATADTGQTSTLGIGTIKTISHIAIGNTARHPRTEVTASTPNEVVNSTV